MISLLKKYLVFVIFISVNVNAQIDIDNHEWKLRKDKLGIKVFTSKVPDSKYLAVSATMKIDATKPESIVSMIMDLENCKEWAVQCAKATALERISETETYLYSRNNIPFPGRDRDAVTHVLWDRNAQTGIISMSSTVVDDNRVEKVKGVIRIKYAIARWRFTPNSDGSLLIESYAHVDPASDMPKWLLNSLLVGSPYSTMKRIRKRLSEGVYDNAVLNF